MAIAQLSSSSFQSDQIGEYKCTPARETSETKVFGASKIAVLVFRNDQFLAVRLFRCDCVNGRSG